MSEKSLIQATEEMLGREPPKPRSERIAEEEREEVVAEADEALKALLGSANDEEAPDDNDVAIEEHVVEKRKLLVMM